MLMITRYHTGLRTQQNMNTFLTSFEYMIYHKVVNKCQSNFVLCIDCFIAVRKCWVFFLYACKRPKQKQKKTFGLTYPIVVGKFKSQVQHDATCICPTKMLYVYENMGKKQLQTNHL